MAGCYKNHGFFMIFSDGSCIYINYALKLVLQYTLFLVCGNFSVDWPGESSSSPVNNRFGCVCLSKCPMYRMWPVRSPLATTWSFSWTCNLWLKKRRKNLPIIFFSKTTRLLDLLSQYPRKQLQYGLQIKACEHKKISAKWKLHVTWIAKH